jgi:phosphatidylglycerophosphate synthase
LDHGVDKVVSMSISYIFYKFSLLPVWAFCFFFLRDLLILLVGGVLYFGFRVALGSLWLGKIAGIFYFGMFFALLLGFEHLGKFLMIISVFLFAIVVIVYPIKFYPILKIKIFSGEGGVE